MRPNDRKPAEPRPRLAKKSKRPKPFIIEHRMTDEFMDRIPIFKRLWKNEWRVWKRYQTAEARDTALTMLRRKERNANWEYRAIDEATDGKDV